MRRADACDKSRTAFLPRRSRPAPTKGDSPSEDNPLDDDRRRRLVGLYAELAAHTAPECAARCTRPFSCCEERYCLLTIDYARENWAVDLQPTWHRRLPLMGPDGCTAAPHLRPMCTAHTCEISEYGCKRGEEGWTERYFELRNAITEIEAEIFRNVLI